MTGTGPQAIQVGGFDYSQKPGLSVEDLTRFLRDIDYQPSWRARADVDADYYDSNQYDAKTLQEMEEKGIPPIVVNLVAPTINLILGMEAKVRQDWVVRADDDDKVEFGEALTKELQKAERLTHADRACSDAYAGQVKTGLHWVEVRHQRMNPLKPKFQVEAVHRREIWWDWQDLSPTLEKARWLVRRKFYDYDVLRVMFARFKNLIDEIHSGWAMFETRSQLDVGHLLYQDWLVERDWEFDLDTWRNEERQQAMVYEVWYRILVQGYFMHLPNDQVLEFNRNDPVHAAAVGSGKVKVTRGVVPKMRLSWWLGPHRLEDMPSPLPHNNFPYIPFFAYREDRTGVPYGQVRTMRPLQDEVNSRRARMLWQLSARRLIAMDNAVKDKRAVEQEIARPDAAIWLDSSKNKNKSIGDIFQVDDQTSLTAQQFQAYVDAKETLQDVANVFKEQLGKLGSGAESGIAISTLIEQGTTALAELNENYTFSRKLVGEQLLSLVKADIGQKEHEIKYIQTGSMKKKSVTLNERSFDKERNIRYRNNDLTMTKSHVELDAVPASAAFRQYQFQEMANIVKTLPPEFQGAMLDMVVQASDMPTAYKDEMVKRVRDQLGIEESNPEEMSPEEQKAFEEKVEVQELVKALQLALQKFEVERADLENREIDAKTEKLEAETKKIEEETDAIEAEPDAASEDRIPGTRNLPTLEVVR